MYLQNHSAPPEDHEELTTELFEPQRPPAEEYTRTGSHDHHQAALDSYDTGVTQLPVTGQDSVDFDH
jgi:hypothetical protein